MAVVMRQTSIRASVDDEFAARDFAAALDFDQEIRIELRILVHPVFRIAARIAHYSRSIQDVVDAVMDVPMYPQACPASVDEVLGIRDKARIQ